MDILAFCEEVLHQLLVALYKDVTRKLYTSLHFMHILAYYTQFVQGAYTRHVTCYTWTQWSQYNQYFPLKVLDTILLLINLKELVRQPHVIKSEHQNRCWEFPS